MPPEQRAHAAVRGRRLEVEQQRLWACLGHVMHVSWTGLVCELRDVALPLERATSRDSLAKPRPDERSPEDGTNWPTTFEPPPADGSKVTSLTIVFSSRTVPHWMHTASPRAASVSISVDLQLGQQRRTMARLARD